MTPETRPAAVDEAMSLPNDDHPDVIAFPPLILLTTSLAGGLLHLAWPVHLLAPAPSRIAGGVLVFLAGLWALWARRTMLGAGTNVRPDKPALALVFKGPFRITRNPMYLSLCAIQVGVALLIDGLMPLLFLVPLALMLHFGVIKREERYLAGKFGEPYVGYRGQVRRWL